MTLETDDKTYNIEETLLTCEKESIPMILDYHHYMANRGEGELSCYLQRIFNTRKLQSVYQKSIFHRRGPKKRFVHMLILFRWILFSLS